MNQSETGSKTGRHNSDTTNAGADIGSLRDVWGENGTREQQKEFLDKARNDDAYALGSMTNLTQDSKTLSEGTIGQSDSKATNAQLGLSKFGTGATTSMQYRSDDSTRVSAEGVENRGTFGQIVDNLDASLEQAGGDSRLQEEAYNEAITATQNLYDANTSDKVDGYAPQVAGENRGPMAGTGNNSDLAQIEAGLKERLGNFIEGAGDLIPSWISESGSKEELNGIALDNAVQDYEKSTGEQIPQEMRERLGELVQPMLDDEINKPEQNPLVQEKYNKME